MKKFKFNMILGKKQIMLASLVLVLSIAVYLNYTFTRGSDDYSLSVLQQGEAEEGETETYGEAQMTSAGGNEMDEYFVSARLERKKARDEAVETLANTLKDADVSDEEKELATSKAIAVSKQIEQENKIETLVKAKGFTECLAFVDDETVRVVVKTEGLTAEQAAQIKNIVIEETEVLTENISVVEQKDE